ncbi:MAG: GNAT family N-acetyltransferase [Aggregatilineales bacterium]
MATVDYDRLSKRVAIPASHYDAEALAAIYNETRIDYIVPMPMNARRMLDYITNYDIQLESSIVALNDSGVEAGIGMLGLREKRAWITRLGVLPNNRGLHMGQFLMERLLDNATEHQAERAQLEVIVGNDPAHGLFTKLGFEEIRRLLIIRRPPSPIEANADLDDADVTEIAIDDIPAVLATREPDASWVEETPSILNAGKLKGIAITLNSGEKGWAVYQSSPFQLSHFVLSPSSDEMIETLLYHIHKNHPMQDTKIENVPSDHPTWQIFQKMGYIEVFSRLEMYLTL